MKVSDLMTGEIYALHLNQTLKEAAELFLNRHIDGAPALDDEGRLLGLVSKSHLYRAIASEEDVDTPIEKVMLVKPITISANDELDKVKQLEVSRLPVMEGERLVGMLTQTDLVKAFYIEMDNLTQKLIAVIDSAYNAIVSIDGKGNVSIFNPPAERLFGVKKGNALGRPFTEVIPNGDLVNVLKLGNVQTGMSFKHGNHTLVSNRSPIIVDGKVVGAVAVVQDISELQNVVDELEYVRQLKRETDAIIDSSFDGIYVTDGNGKTLMINEAYSRISGIQASEVVGKYMHDLVEEGLYDRSVTLMVMEELKPVTTVQELKSGKTILVTGSPIFDEEGNLFRVVTNVRDITELNQLKQDVEDAQHLSIHYKEELKKIKMEDNENYIVKSQKSKDLIDLIMRLGQVDSTVLIQGESGVGKEMIADILHNNSMRRDSPLIRINCGAIPETLLESELFGYETGAFTGAKKGGKIGIFELANRGSLFLDEIGELPMASQVKLLRAIQQREITRLGGDHPIKIDVRLIAATNRDLWQMVMKNEFRKDLFYRLNVVPVMVHPLRERKEEMPAFINHFVNMFNQRYGFHKTLNEKAMRSLMDYDWPGNVRELENVIERAIVTSSSSIIDEVQLPTKDEASVSGNFAVDLKEGMKLKDAMEGVEKHLIQTYLDQYGSTRKVAAALGVSQPTIVRKAAKYGIGLRD